MKKRFCQLNSKEGIFGIFLFLALIAGGVCIAIFSNQVETIVLVSILLVCLLGMGVYELFFSSFITLNEDHLITNNDIITDSEKYKNHLFKTVMVEYKDIKNVEERIIGNKKRIVLTLKKNIRLEILIKYGEEKVFSFLKDKAEKL